MARQSAPRVGATLSSGLVPFVKAVAPVPGGAAIYLASAPPTSNLGGGMVLWVAGEVTGPAQLCTNSQHHPHHVGYPSLRALA